MKSHYIEMESTVAYYILRLLECKPGRSLWVVLRPWAEITDLRSVAHLKRARKRLDGTQVLFVGLYQYQTRKEPSIDPVAKNDGAPPIL